MIRDELNTGFRWYDDIDKQSRYKDYCAAVCEYKRLTPLNAILPFQFNTRDTPVTISGWDIFCAEDDQLYVDLGGSIGSKLSIVTLNGEDHIIYSGAAIASLSLPCGSYYSRIITSTGNFYSEVFYCEDITDTTFAQMNFPLFTAWRWYDDPLKANRYRTNCEDICPSYVLLGNDALLPFMFRKLYDGIPPDEEIVDSWILEDLDGECNTLLDTSLIRIVQVTTYTPYTYHYVYYLGEALSGLPCGTYQSILTISGVPYYSEPITILSTLSTNNPDSNYLLQETGNKILQQNGFGILLE